MRILLHHTPPPGKNRREVTPLKKKKYRQQSRNAFSIASPARMIDTPQTLPVKPRPEYSSPVGVVTTLSSNGR